VGLSDESNTEKVGEGAGADDGADDTSGATDDTGGAEDTGGADDGASDGDSDDAALETGIAPDDGREG